MAAPAVQFQNVSKRFQLGDSAESLGGLAAHILRGAWKRKNANFSNDFWALRDVSFDVAEGEAIGVIGPNGAGKSTVLKLLARILAPDAGRVTVHGRLAALIEIGAGFHGDLTGRENVFLHGSILGMNRAEIRRKFDAIVAFAGLETFIHTPVKRYSSGMYARLGFSIAAHIDPQVLLVDEVLSVGDALFRLRCMEKMRELIRGGTTLVFVTHQLEQMQAICQRTIVLTGGKIAFDGDPRSAVSHYMNAVAQAQAARPTDICESSAQGRNVAIGRVRFLDGSGRQVSWTRPNDRLRAEVTLKVHQPVRRMVLELNMRSEAQTHVLSLNSGRAGVELSCAAGTHTFLLELAQLPVCGGQYAWNVRVWDNDRGTTEADTPFQYWLGVDDEGRATGALTVAHEWTHIPEKRPDVHALDPSTEAAALAV